MPSTGRAKSRQNMARLYGMRLPAALLALLAVTLRAAVVQAQSADDIRSEFTKRRTPGESLKPRSLWL